MTETLRLPDIRKTGFDEVILWRASTGEEPGEISEYIRQHHNIEVAPETVGRFLAQFDTDGLREGHDALVLRELRRESREMFHRFKQQYEAALERYREAETELDEVQFMAREMREWFDNRQNLVVSDDADVTALIAGNDINTQVNPVQVLVDELDEEDPDRAADVIDRLEDDGVG